MKRNTITIDLLPLDKQFFYRAGLFTKDKADAVTESINSFIQRQALYYQVSPRKNNNFLIIIYGKRPNQIVRQKIAELYKKPLIQKEIKLKSFEQQIFQKKFNEKKSSIHNSRAYH